MTTPLEVKHEQFERKGSFFVERDGTRLAEMTYSRTPDAKHFIIDHTEVFEVLKGQGVGRQLVQASVEYARKEKLSIMPLCPFAKATFDKTPEWSDVLWK
jgi:predicted GNAT family acetyltransferase